MAAAYTHPPISSIFGPTLPPLSRIAVICYTLAIRRTTKCDDLIPLLQLLDRLHLPV
jgi:hypothetical protein